MKCIFLLFLGFSLSTFSQSLERQLYTTYFKSLYLYEPAVIRKQKIESLTILSSEFRKDSMTFSALKEKAVFRKDGRPISHVVYTDFHRDSILYDYRYDSLGNLVEFKKWKPKNRWEKNDNVEQHFFFKYAQNRLEQVFSFYMNHDMQVEMMQRCDSLKYETDQEHVTIFTGNEKGFKIGLFKELRFIYPLNLRATHVLYSPASKALSPPVDDENLWNNSGEYGNENLKLIQKITGTKCIDNRIVQVAETINFCSKDSLNSVLLKGTKIMSYVMEDSGTLIIDTLIKELIIKSDLLSIQPTSMEDRVSRTISHQYFNYDMRLLRIETSQESSRGMREHFLDSSTVSFTYFDFGLIQMKQEEHQWRSACDTNSEAIRFVESMTLTKWE